ncbi:GNAT family N-acetyltransferase [Pollutibacter soli]|uniref:GNAT family N-acetyltransferase n=1 Tax=Pollutibacter soli TaxID=3034157 RepID=UPI00301352B1
MLNIRLFQTSDFKQVLNILKEVVSGGDTYSLSPQSTDEELESFWFAKGNHVYVCAQGDDVIGTFFIRNNQPGLGSHIANAGFMVSKYYGGRGAGRMMGEFAIVEAKQLGFDAMQFNYVVKSNTYAVELWKKLGFQVMAEIPDAFRHITLGLTPVYIMYRKL